jgi:flagellum-specific ATP synthase/type III secretion protein N (ATPase)
VRLAGRVAQVVGLTIEARGLDCHIGEVCEIHPASVRPGTGRLNTVCSTSGALQAEVVGFREERTLLMPLGDMQGIQPGSPVYPQRSVFRAPVGHGLLGRVLDGLGRPIDGRGRLDTPETAPIENTAPHPLQRQPISQPLVTGVRAVDGLLTVGKGQRLGIFAGSGVGKSTLLGAIARSSKSDVSVIALIGERGRELQEFIDRDLGKMGLARSVVVCATSDQPALVRLKAAWVAMTIAEYFRDQGLDVTLMMDSVTRFAMAQREVGLAVGEPPASKGYTPSVFALLPKLLERAANGARGTLTGFFTVLVEGDDFNEPICDAVRSILDGHIMLTRELAARNHYPAIDVLQSVSRVMPAVIAPEHKDAAGHFRRLLAAYERARDLVNIGAYVKGSDAEIDAALTALPHLMGFLQQGVEFTPFETTLVSLSNIHGVRHAA